MKRVLSILNLIVFIFLELFIFSFIRCSLKYFNHKRHFGVDSTVNQTAMRGFIPVLIMQRRQTSNRAKNMLVRAERSVLHILLHLHRKLRLRQYALV
jgi:hypothetical protein